MAPTGVQRKGQSVKREQQLWCNGLIPKCAWDRLGIVVSCQELREQMAVEHRRHDSGSSGIAFETGPFGGLDRVQR
jgi:hypothetical protein